ncbi:MAG: head-tail adaptor protein [Chloroflexi bacterium]|nr:head-tail adaptor protein [Chloroflexota bacterium]
MPASSQVVAMMQRVAAGFFTDTCLLEREVSTTGEYGEPVHAWEVTASDVPCRIIMVGQRYGGGVAEAGAAETMKREYRLVVAATVSLAVDMRVTVGGVTYDITRIETQLTDEVFQQCVIQGRD